MNTHKPTTSESGVVSIFAVIMFMIFVSIMAVGFIRIVNDEKRQALDNDLSASAYASAQSGVEEAKRILLFCQDPTINAAQQAACASILNNTSCDAVTGLAATQVRTALGITTETDASIGRIDGIVSKQDGYEQRWTCMNISPQTDSVKNKYIGSATGASVGSGIVIPLKAVGTFSKVTLSWHNTAESEGVPALRSPIDRISQPDWVAGNYPAALRVEVIAHPKTGINIDNLSDATKTVVLFPSSNAASPTSIDLATADVRANDPNSRVAPSVRGVRCNVTSTYACNIDLSFLAMPSTATTDYYLRITSYYRDTHVAAQLFDIAGPAVKFDGVQPEVDVTGRTNDVFRRIKASLDFGSGMYAPNFAIDSGQTFCKDMLVTDNAGTSADSCMPYPSLP